MKLDDFALGILMLCVSVAIGVSSLQFVPIPGQAYGAETMPRTLAIFCLGVGAFLTIRGERVAGLGGRHVMLAEWARSPRALLGVAIALGLILVYIGLVDRLGFVPLAFAIMAVLMLTLRTGVVVTLVVSLVAAVLIQQAFGRLLLVPLPRSPFLGFLW